MASATVVKVSTAEEFDKLIDKDEGQLFVIHFWASWAKECSQINEVIALLADEFVHVQFAEVEAEELVAVSKKCHVAKVPTVVLFKGGKIVDSVEGANVPALNKAVRAHVAAFVNPISLGSRNGKVSKEDLNARLKRLINRAPCVLFMKGSPSEPRCGFSREITQIFKEQNVDYQHFDILSDDSVRQGLKEYSNWPTYPQLYSNGELIGGLDIVKELTENGELGDTLPKKTEDMNSRLTKLINQARIMLFMKGSPEEPKCGFSKAITGILALTKVDYSSFDILEDSEVRDSLKKFSNWPTYPQLYVNGELIGGLDIVKELNDSDELEQVLSP